MDEERRIIHEMKKDTNDREYCEMAVTRHIYYFFCPRDDHDGLFHKIDQASHMPMLPDFQNYILEEAQQRRKREISKPLANS